MRYEDKEGREIQAGDVLHNPWDAEGYIKVLEREDGRLFLGDMDSPLEKYRPEKWWTISNR